MSDDKQKWVPNFSEQLDGELTVKTTPASEMDMRIFRAASYDAKKVEAIRELMEQEAIAFIKWVSHKYVEGIDRQVGYWFDHRGECIARTNEELYELFKQSKSK